jgi:hypothetical protein
MRTPKAIAINNWITGVVDGNIQPMKQQIELESVTLTKDGETLTVRHHKTGLVHEISALALVRWLVRQLRSVF